MFDIQSNPDIPWYWPYISKNTNLTMDFVENHINKHIDSDSDWDLLEVARHHNFTPEPIMKHICKYLPGTQIYIQKPHWLDQIWSLPFNESNFNTTVNTTFYTTFYTTIST